MDLYDEFQKVIVTLQSEGIEFAVCGGIALALHGHPRFTNDVDLLVQPQDVERIVDLFQAKLGFQFDAGIMPFGQGPQQTMIRRSTKILRMPRLMAERTAPQQTMIRRSTKIVGQDPLILDLLVMSPAFCDVWATRETFAWQGQHVTVVSAAGLAKMKRLAGRPQDLVDLEKLGFDPNDPTIQP